MYMKGVILNLIVKNNKERLQHRVYGLNEYYTGYADGYHNALVDLLNRLGMEHDEERR